MRQIVLQYSIFLIMVFAILYVVAYAIFWKKRIFHSEEEYRAMDMPQEQLRICLKLSKALDIVTVKYLPNTYAGVIVNK